MKRWIPIFVVLALLLTMPGFAFAADESSDAKKLSLSGHAEGFGDADLWISGTALDAVANITEDDMLLLRVDGVVRGEPVNAVLGIKEDGVYLAFPDIYTFPIAFIQHMIITVARSTGRNPQPPDGSILQHLRSCLSGPAKPLQSSE